MDDEVIFVFRAGRRERLQAPGEAPTEFLYGFPQLTQYGWRPRFLEDADIGMGPPLSPLAALVNRAARFFGRLPLGMVVPLFQRRLRSRLPNEGLVVATTNGIGLALGMGRLLGLVRARVVLLAMGLLPADAGAWRRWLVSRVARRLELVTISRGEQHFLQGVMKGREVRYVPFGVDYGFWFPGAIPVGGGYVLAIGNDLNRDWDTLVAAWTPELPPLKIITSLPVPAGPPNVEVIRGDWRTTMLTDEEIRELYWGAAFVVIPVRDTIQPSGQSACLQAMACGKAVIMGDNRGLWDREVMRDGDNVLLYRPGDVSALRNAAERLSTEAALREALGLNGRSTIDTHYNTDVMAEALATTLRQLSSNK